MNKLIGILGGTFDPIHYGHLRPALDIMQQVGLSEVRFTPNRIPPHRETPKLSDLQRSELVELAISDTPGFVLDGRELQRDGPSYMVDTLQSLKDDFPEDALCLMMGMDAFNGLQQWHRWNSLLELSHIIVTTRPEVEMAEFAMQDPISSVLTDDPQRLLQRPAGQILLQSVTQLDISASQIRSYLSAGRSTQYLLPETVREKLEQAYAE
ncbi:MAG: nicotinic acid mononucleotide adenylyltransferase [endosymbiont of Galathealinum brachiosum]|uniref:Probable nicotinate-nucleotide adenylyltransferase n=1 Tax=endosymbiont of Galathealinum brachiosum TaxID=2200906 RepID=A0A370DLB1_9GAMM|nr:MAG: nicotinic acid mononucleotide adenylyltransferase [endosymbiont of Galathealinum brachiosum]